MSACRWLRPEVDAALGLAGRHPLLAQWGERIVAVALDRNARGVDEHLLDFGAGVGFLGGHGAVPTSTPSTGMSGRPYSVAHSPVM